LRGTRALAVAAWALLCATPALAADPFSGRWASDPRACTDEGALVAPLTVAPLWLAWPGAACMVRTSYRLRDAWHMSARCFGEGAISEVAIRLQMRGERLVLDWAKARPEELRRCP
jgi:hypothetical protein